MSGASATNPATTAADGPACSTSPASAGSTSSEYAVNASRPSAVDTAQKPETSAMSAAAMPRAPYRRRRIALPLSAARPTL